VELVGLPQVGQLDPRAVERLLGNLFAIELAGFQAGGVEVDEAGTPRL
jgi:hypothetical protein